MKSIKTILLIFCFCLTQLRATEITVYAAASLTDVLKELGSNFEKETKDRVLFNFGSSSTLARQIDEGAPADIFFSADEEKMDTLEKGGTILKETRTSLLSNTLVLVISLESKLSIRSLQDLTKSEVKRIALSEPQTVPVGIYAKKYLQKLNLWDKVVDKIIPTESVRASLAAVESDNIDVGIVYRTDALISKKVRLIYEVPRNEGPKISYPMAVIKESKHLESAKSFLRFLKSKRSKDVFQKYGFIVLE